ncbi:single-stranded DNA-binding protein WHY1, chloroplastic-like [Euphorbia lathyris]|uniref:single-stranded DNA-binding protein WHY1, chloroplastic-like n=1 Tax=Euphorbia lathyris TaxID=212925 RepID=UPI00331395CF
MQQLNLLSPQLTSQNPKLLCSHCFLFSPQSSLTTTFNLRTPTLSLTKKFTNSKLAVKCRQSEFYDQQRLNSPPRPPSPSPYYAVPSSASVGELPPKVFVGHSIYKGKAALTVEPRAPEFAALESGAFKIAREGFILLQFAPSAGVRQYDWSRKQVFSLSVTEIGTLLSLGAKDSCEFFHDPNKGKSDEGKVRKVLKVEPLPDGSGHFFNLSVQNKLLNMDESIYIPVTKAEFAILTSAFNYILPYLLGWHAFANAIKPDENLRSNFANSRYGGDYEWNK